jgi:hypothetical protein
VATVARTARWRNFESVSGPIAGGGAWRSTTTTPPNQAKGVCCAATAAAGGGGEASLHWQALLAFALDDSGATTTMTPTQRENFQLQEVSEISFVLVVPG